MLCGIALLSAQQVVQRHQSGYSSGIPFKDEDDSVE
jgi:hypothetical protein